MKRLILLALTAMLTSTMSAQVKYPFQDPSLTREERVENLLSLLTADEKVGLMMNKSASARLDLQSRRIEYQHL